MLRAAARRRAQLTAIAMIVLLTAAIAGMIGRTKPTWSESAQVMFMLPRDQHAPDAYYVHSLSLITSEQAFIQVLDRAQEGHAGISMQLVNFYNQEYPEFPEPLATLTSAAPSRALAHRGFTAAARRLSRLVAGWQARAGVAPPGRIRVQVFADTGAAAHRGSLKRSLAGLALLAVIAAVTAWRRLRQKPRPAGAVPRARPA